MLVLLVLGGVGAWLLSRPDADGGLSPDRGVSEGATTGESADGTDPLDAAPAGEPGTGPGGDSPSPKRGGSIPQAPGPMPTDGTELTVVDDATGKSMPGVAIYVSAGLPPLGTDAPQSPSLEVYS